MPTSFEYHSSGEDTGRRVTFEGVDYKEVSHSVMQCKVVRDEDGKELSRSVVEILHDATHWEPAGDDQSWMLPLCYKAEFWSVLDDDMASRS